MWYRTLYLNFPVHNYHSQKCPVHSLDCSTQFSLVCIKLFYVRHIFLIPGSLLSVTFTLKNISSKIQLKNKYVFG